MADSALKTFQAHPPIVTEGFDFDAIWEPFIDPIWGVGYKVTRVGAPLDVKYVLLNPSGSSEGGQPNVFVYVGNSDDPACCEPEIFIEPFQC